MEDGAVAKRERRRYAVIEESSVRAEKDPPPRLALDLNDDPIRQPPPAPNPLRPHPQIIQLLSTALVRSLSSIIRPTSTGKNPATFVHASHLAADTLHNPPRDTLRLLPRDPAAFSNAPLTPYGYSERKQDREPGTQWVPIGHDAEGVVTRVSTLSSLYYRSALMHRH
ncbi:hypothetical protein NLJ89_g9166 [Agrocybe chaxingu]|uniref:Uncharacterized protein n=1 Tax=Agrocybe chaxingu TaxID=84603 RepID=A0A9W8JWA4_9AGAR|nr:hypothetical protein NLJ89_g9166 [Agrocybe chaxingu]